MYGTFSYFANRLATRRWGQVWSQKELVRGVIWFDCVDCSGYVVDSELFNMSEVQQRGRFGGELYNILGQRCGRYDPDSTLYMFASGGARQNSDWAVLIFHYPGLAEIDARLGLESRSMGLKGPDAAEKFVKLALRKVAKSDYILALIAQTILQQPTIHPLKT